MNKVSTKADLRLNVFDAEWLPEEVRMALLDMEANRVNSAGELVVQSDRTRTQKGNLEDALRKLQVMIDAAVVKVTPKEKNPEKEKRVKKLKAKAKERRLDNKKRHSQKKSLRRQKDFD